MLTVLCWTLILALYFPSLYEARPGYEARPALSQEGLVYWLSHVWINQPIDPCSPSFLVRRDKKENGRMFMSMAWPSVSSWLLASVHSNQTQGKNTFIIYISSLGSLIRPQPQIFLFLVHCLPWFLWPTLQKTLTQITVTITTTLLVQWVAVNIGLLIDLLRLKGWC